MPLRLFAEIVEERDGPNQIQREQRAAGASSSTRNSDGRATWPRSSPTSARVLAEVKLPQGYSTSLEGTFQAQEEATLRIGAAVAGVARR